MQIDGKSQPFITVDNIRITKVIRSGEKDWAGTGTYLGFRATVGDSNRVMMGPEIPMRNDNVTELIRAIRKLAK